MARESADKPSFNVYGMLTILTTLLMGGACYLLFDDLTKNWGFQMFGDKPTAKRATHLTELRPVGANTPFVMLRKEDREDWDNISEDIKHGKDFPIKNYEWPTGYDPLKFPVQPSVNTAQKAVEDKAWADAIAALLSTAEKETPLDAPKTPEAPKTEEKKDDATKTEAPKTEEKKTEEKKEEAPKTDEKKTEEKKEEAK